MRKSVSFDNIVVVGHTHDADNYDRTSTPPRSLTPNEMGELFMMRARMNQITALLNSKRMAIERQAAILRAQSAPSSFLPIRQPQNRIRPPSPPSYHQSTSPPRHNDAQWPRRKPVDLTCMTRSPPRSYSNIPTDNHHHQDTSSFSGDRTPYLSSAPSSPSADSVSSITSAFVDTGYPDSETSFSHESALFDDILPPPAPPSGSTAQVPVPAAKKGFGAIGSSRPSVVKENTVVPQADEYSPFGGSSGFLYTFYKYQGLVSAMDRKMNGVGRNSRRAGGIGY
ncbi:hypothetical protein HDU79_008213 [Rhizoclosmatium sp. JEL0117]|nr:hypothetical protein HDU79_008213 [Rhizoclosmatium sp. JEL0117]